jgi:antitoxin component YwqK of YwqJK toxin-antitoxin module
MRQTFTTLPGTVAAAVLTVASWAAPLNAQPQSKFPLMAPEAAQLVPQSADQLAIDIRENATPASGVVEVVQERYADGKVKVERQVTLDERANYVNHGTWKMWLPTGAPVAEGQYHMGQPVGTWTRWLAKGEAVALNVHPFNGFRPPFVSQATFVDGKLDGEWLIVDANRRQVMQISLSLGKRNGPVTMWLPNGKAFRQATYSQGVAVGDVLEINSRSGQMEVAATFIDGRKVVTKTTNHQRTRQKETEESFLAATTVEQSPDEFWTTTFATYRADGKDLRHGPTRTWYEDGKPRSEGNYEYDKRSGPFITWFANGQAASMAEYRDDKPVGTWVTWHENGLKSAIGEYRDGYLYGLWRWWGQDGQLAKQRVYDGTEKLTVETESVLSVGGRPPILGPVIR